MSTGSHYLPNAYNRFEIRYKNLQSNQIKILSKKACHHKPFITGGLSAFAGFHLFVLPICICSWRFIDDIAGLACCNNDGNNHGFQWRSGEARAGMGLKATGHSGAFRGVVEVHNGFDGSVPVATQTWYISACMFRSNCCFISCTSLNCNYQGTPENRQKIFTYLIGYNEVSFLNLHKKFDSFSQL